MLSLGRSREDGPGLRDDNGADVQREAPPEVMPHAPQALSSTRYNPLDYVPYSVRQKLAQLAPSTVEGGSTSGKSQEKAALTREHSRNRKRARKKPQHRKHVGYAEEAAEEAENESTSEQRHPNEENIASPYLER